MQINLIKLNQKGGMLRGKIKEVIRENGYGLIEAEDGREISFRTPGINEADFKTLKEGDTVEFDVKRELHRCRFRAVKESSSL